MEVSRYFSLLIAILICSLHDSKGIDAPGDVTVADEGSTNSLKVTWIPPANATAHEVTWSPPDGPDNGTSSDLNGTATVYNITGLTPGTLYNVNVTAKNGPSDSVTFGPEQGRTNPNSVVLEEVMITTRQITVMWDDPVGMEDFFEVDCAGNGNTDTTLYPYNVTDNTFQATCDVPMAGADFDITVTTVSGDKQSSVTGTFTAATPDQVEMMEKSSNTTSITVTWSVLPPADGFEVVCSEGTSYPDSPLPGSATQVTCQGVTPGGNHSVSIVTLENNGRSPATVIYIVAVPESVNLTEESEMVTTTSITASWNNATGVFDYYKVSCPLGVPSPDQVNPSDDLRASCTGLRTPGDDYDISVTTVSSGQSSATDTITITALPAEVTDLMELGSTTASVSANWTKPFGVVSNYNITCPDGSTQTVPENNDNSTRSVNCTGLPDPGPGGNHNITVITLSDNKASSQATVTITALPNAVELIEGPANNTAISATWTIPNSVVDTFQITCSNGTASPASITVESSPTADYFTAYCTGLPTPGLEYIISVVAISNGKRSAISTEGVHAFPAGVVLEEGPSTMTSVNASWMKPESAVEHYSITCSSGSASPSLIEETGQQYYSASCVNLTTPGDTYNMTVNSIVNNGMTTTSSSIKLVALPAKVTDLMELGATTASVSADWTKPVGVVSNYNITCPDGSTQTVPENNDNSPRSVNCTGLPEDPGPGGNHTIIVITLSDNKASSPARVTITAYPNSVVLEEVMNTTRQITVMWDDPDGVEDYFLVDCGDDRSTDFTLFPYNATNNTFQATCDVPMAGADYDITVTSVSGNKQSPVTNTFTAETPMQVTITNMTSDTTSISVSWDAFSGADMFEVNCSDGSPFPNSSLPGSNTQVTCQGVMPGGSHSVSIVTLENNGRSPAVVTYVAAVPDAVVLTEASDMVNESSISASWNMPNGIVEYYEVSCPLGVPSPDRVNPSDDLTASCTGLRTPGDDYNISVTAVSNGQSSATDTITITALPEAVELEEGASNTTVISATWTIPDSVVDTFSITCSNGTADPASIPVDSSQAGEQLTAYCIGLPTSGEQYFLSVVANSKDKQSAVSRVGVFALPYGVDLVEGPSTLTSVSASWMRQNDTVESYSIRCSNGDPLPSTIEDTTQESYSASCVNLTGPGATYSMTVYSEVGTNSVSNSTRASSLIQLVAVPESVENITVADYNTTTVDVRWHLKQCAGCIYDDFILTFEPDSQDPIRVGYMNGNEQYTSQVSGLTQGRNYIFTVVSVSGDGVEGATSKTSEEQSVEQRTVPATPHALDITPFKETLSLEWRYRGDADDFNITITPDEGTFVFNGNLTYPAGEVTGLTPGRNYNVSVVTISGDEMSEPLTNDTRTLPDKPSPVQNPMAEADDKNTITVTYESPANPNGVIVSYKISYVGTRNNFPEHAFSNVYDTVLSVTFEDLYPGFSYTFTIIAVNDGNYESDPAPTEPVKTPEEEPTPVREDYPYEANTNIPETSTTTFAVELPADLFSHENGELMTFAVIITAVANDPDVGSTELNYNDADSQRVNGIAPAYITITDIPYPYPPSFESSRKRRATEPSAVVVIGDGTCTGSPKEYCNEPLNDNTEYHYAFRAYNGAGDETSGTFGPVKTDKDNTVAIAVGVSVSLIIIIVSAVVVGVILKRRGNVNSPRPRSLMGSDNPGFVTPGQEMGRIQRKPGSSMHRKGNSKPVVLNNFEEHYRRMKADSDFRFTEEYDEIRQVGKGQPMVAALEMVNRPKNRFTNILPYDHSRVKLAALADEPDTDYINANYMPGYNSPREFIACQGPLPGTVDDMWRMIWEKNTSIIVMLTQLVEMGKIKCHQYWPEDYNSVTYGSVVVSLQAMQQYEHWVIREFTVVKGDDIRKLTHYHFMSWPDHGVPNKTWTMLDFVRMVRESIRKHRSDHPVIAHCSAGVGRTGTYIALDRLMQAMQENDYVDIFGIICEMRMQRNHMVQTEKQYIFIHECVMDVLRRGDDDTGESIYVNLGANGHHQGDVNRNLLDQAV